MADPRSARTTCRCLVAVPVEVLAPSDVGASAVTCSAALCAAGTPEASCGCLPAAKNFLKRFMRRGSIFLGSVVSVVRSLACREGGRAEAERRGQPTFNKI